MTNSWSVFNGKAVRQMAQDDHRQLAASKGKTSRPVDSRWQKDRFVLKFRKGFSVEQVAYWESVTTNRRILRLEVQQAIREALAEMDSPKVVEMPLPRRLEKAA